MTLTDIASDIDTRQTKFRTFKIALYPPCEKYVLENESDELQKFVVWRIIYSPLVRHIVSKQDSRESNNCLSLLKFGFKLI
jgi:hypothetical protein